MLLDSAFEGRASARHSSSPHRYGFYSAHTARRMCRLMYAMQQQY